MPRSTKFNVRLFADDTNLTINHQKSKDLEKMANNELKHITNWMKLNQLSTGINYNKTEYVVMTNKKEKPTFPLHIDENVIKQSNCVKYLGVLIDSSLNWKPQIQKVCTKLASACWALYQLRKYVDYKTLVMVYNSTLHSHLMYCISSGGSASNSNMRPLFLLQKRAM